MKNEMDQLAAEFEQYCIKYTELLNGQTLDATVDYAPAFVLYERTFKVFDQFARGYDDLKPMLNGLQLQWAAWVAQYDNKGLIFMYQRVATLLLCSYASDLGFESWKTLYPQYAGYLEQAYVTGQAFFDRETVLLGQYAS